MSIQQSTECPLCNQFVPADTRSITLKNGRKVHEGCAKEIAQLYMQLTMKSENPKSKHQRKNKRKPKRTPQKKVSNDSKADSGK